jgi:hypothetical protein
MRLNPYVKSPDKTAGILTGLYGYANRYHFENKDDKPQFCAHREGQREAGNDLKRQAQGLVEYVRQI